VVKEAVGCIRDKVVERDTENLSRVNVGAFLVNVGVVALQQGLGVGTL
jgi:hypothetical protein